MDHDEHSGHSSHHNAHEGMEPLPHPVPAGTSEHAAHGEQVSPTGHTAHGAQVDHTGHEAMFRRRFWISLVLSLPVLLYSPMIQEWLHFSMPQFPGSQWVEALFSVAVFLYGGTPFLAMAVPEIQARRPGMMTLISLAIGVAFIYSLAGLFLPVGGSFFWELVTLIDVMLLGHWLEMRSVRQASGALSELARLMPDTAERINPDGSQEVVSIASIRADDVVLVRPGSSMPADGVVISGESEVSEAMITGESKPVSKTPGSQVIAGTINGDSSLRVQVTASGDQTVLAGIMRLVEQAQQSKSDTQVLADKAAGWLFYIALGVALLTGVVWSAVSGVNVQVVERIATVLVIACPHALGLAIPLVVAITTSLGARNGILVRDRLALESAREIEMVIFDKTGTLTQGEFGVVAIVTQGSWEENEALALAAAIEGDSEHTIARGFRRTAEQRNLNLPAIREFEILKGRGVQAEYQGGRVFVGGPRLIEALGVRLEGGMVEFNKMAGQRGYSAVYLIVDGEAVAGFALADMIRPESKPAIKRLHEMGIEVSMLTGDASGVAASVAEELGIDQYFAELLPEHKDEIVAEQQRQGKRLAMVGDGVNDAPALARADVGIAIGCGTDIAIESAGIILVMNNPLDVVKIFTLSRASYRKMVQNLIWATGYNVVALPLAAGILAPWGILLSPAVGALFMSLSTVIVALNAQLLRRTNLATD